MAGGLYVLAFAFVMTAVPEPEASAFTSNVTCVPSIGTVTLVTSAPPCRNWILAVGASVKIVAAETHRIARSVGSQVRSVIATESPTTGMDAG